MKDTLVVPAMFVLASHLISKNTLPEHPEETEAFKRIESQVEEMSNMGSTPLQAGTDLEYHIRETCRFVFWTKLEDDFLHRVWEIVSSLFHSVSTNIDREGWGF